MTGGENVTIDIEVYCGKCMNGDRSQLMRLTDDVEGHHEGEYRCPNCKGVVVVSLLIGNRH